MFTRERVLMVVKTYPVPSAGYGELVCTAGVRLQDNQWVRIYPYPFRQGDDGSQFRKWEIIEVDLAKTDARDRRPESYKLHDITTLVRTGEVLDTKNSWQERMVYIRSTALPTVRTLLDGIPEKGVHDWGPTIRPVAIQPGARFSSKFDGHDWDAEDRKKLDAMAAREAQSLFSDVQSARAMQKLEKIPYKFYLTFKDLTDVEYTYQIIDWEICALYRNERKRKGSDEAALESVRYKIENQICTSENEVFLILGNINHRYKQEQLAIDGFVYPKLPAPPTLPQQDSLF